MPGTLRPRWIDTPDGVREVAEAVRRAGRMALDTEADSLHSYFHKTCLIQVTAAGRHFLVDPLALDRNDLAPLVEVVADPGIPTLMHGADYDVRVLDRDLGARIRGLEDTQIMAQLLGEPRTGLAALLEKELGVRLDKRHQRADWGRRPLPAGMLAYAAADTAHLEALNGRLRRRLERLGRWAWAEEEFRRLEAVRYERPEPDPLAFERIKGVRRLRGPARDRAHALWAWRDREARRLDVPPFKILGNRQLPALAEEPPRDLDGLAGVEGLGPRFVRRWGSAVLSVLEQPEPAPARVRGGGPRRIELSTEQARRLKALAAARDEAASGLGIEPGLLCPRAVLEALAACPDTDPGTCGLSGWRLAVLGERFRAILGGVLDSRS